MTQLELFPDDVLIDRATCDALLKRLQEKLREGEECLERIVSRIWDIETLATKMGGDEKG